MERRFGRALAQSKRYEVLFQGLQIADANRQTLGEMDFLVRDSLTKVVWHVEFAYKFYLLRDNKQEAFGDWVGPGGKDRLSLKLQKMQRQQFPLLNLSQTVARLKELGLTAASIKSGLAFCGELFVPEGADSSVISSPLCESSFKGRWYAEENDPREERRDLHKSEWIIPPNHLEPLVTNDDHAEYARRGYKMCQRPDGSRIFVVKV